MTAFTTAPALAMPAAVPATIGTATPADAAPSPGAVQRFEALLDGGGRYVAPPAPPASSLLNSDFARHAGRLSEQIRQEIDKPMPLPDDLTEVGQLREVFAQNHRFMRVQVEFEMATKMAELGTRNVQSLYQVQG